MANDQKHLLVIASLIAGALIGGVDAAAGQAMTTPLERAISTPRGQLRTPYPDFANVAAEGLKIYRSHDCNGCHGGGGGGGMAAPLTNQIWIYGDNDDTLFRVIALGTGSSQPRRRVSEARVRAQGLRERRRADAALRRNHQDRR